MEQVDCIVVGAGVVGIAIARKQAILGRDVLLLEAEDAIGTQTSSRNSEVVHAGIYYPPGSAKAALCLPGKEALYGYCQERGIAHKKCGKYIVATNQSQCSALNDIYSNGHKNGVTDLEMVPRSVLDANIPDIRAFAAIWSPSTGIVDSHQLMLSLLGDFEAHGGTLALNSRVQRIVLDNDQLNVTVGRKDVMTIATRSVFNCAGLSASEVAKNTDGLDAGFVPDIEYAKGSYFTYSGRTPFKQLIYPVPAPGGLGIHLTLDQNGQARFGPDVEWVNEIDLSVRAEAKSQFVKAVSDYWPNVDPEKMHAGYSGIRVKAMPQGKNYHDFIFSGPQDHGILGLVNLFGIESPGLTSCFAIADHAANLLNYSG